VKLQQNLNVVDSERVTQEHIRLDGEASDPDLVILLRTAERPDALYGLRAKVSEHHPAENGPDSWRTASTTR